MSNINSTPAAIEFRQRFSYCPETGVFHRLVKGGGLPAGIQAGSFNKVLGYQTIYFQGRNHYCHRLAWLHFYGDWPVGQIDHLNAVKTDNRIANLRDVPQTVNMQNMRKANKASKTGLLGVEVSRDRFTARIKAPNRRIYIGSFATAQEAHEAYLKVKRELHEGCTI